jgi:hypothetical protein
VILSDISPCFNSQCHDPGREKPIASVRPGILSWSKLLWKMEKIHISQAGYMAITESPVVP